VITLPPFLTTLLRNHLQRHDTEFIFTTESGNWLWRSTFIRRILKPAINGNDTEPHPRVCTVPIRPGLTFHGLRHSNKTWLIAGGAPEIAQARRLGHHLTNRVTEVYSHVAPEVELRLLNDLQHRWHTATRNIQAHPDPATTRESTPLGTTRGITNSTVPHTNGMRDTTTIHATRSNRDLPGAECSKTANRVITTRS
jgi:integrase-like protein